MLAKGRKRPGQKHASVAPAAQRATRAIAGGYVEWKLRRKRQGTEITGAISIS
jgi:hypothetical protein